MAFGIATYNSAGQLQFSPNYNPFNVVKTITLTPSTGNGSTTYTPPNGRSLSVVGDTFSANRSNYWLVTQSGNTVSWVKHGNPARTVYIYLVSRA